jgi:hypothetical protein
MGFRKARRLDRLLRQSRSHRHAQGPYPIPRHQARLEPLTCVNLVARKGRGSFLCTVRAIRGRSLQKVVCYDPIYSKLWTNRHAPIEEQRSWLRQVMNGWFAHHAVPCNYPSLNLFRRAVVWYWRRALRRRGQRDTTSWADILRLADRWLPKARILHPWPSQRYAVRPKVGAGCLNRARTVLCGG